MKCRCGHGRQWHHATPGAIAKRRRRGDRTPARQSCQGWQITPRQSGGLSVLACKCRDWHPTATKEPTR